jgi:5'(3')-deoxyribonucleotidase
MNIALDFDDTFTARPDLFGTFVILANARQFNVYIVSSRFDNYENRRDVENALTIERITDKIAGIILCSHNSKHEVMAQKGIKIDIWIDDNPWSIVGVDKPLGA